jgi:hypothetical protein
VYENNLISFPIAELLHSFSGRRKCFLHGHGCLEFAVITPVSSVVIMDLAVVLRGAYLTRLELIENYLSIAFLQGYYTNTES